MRDRVIARDRENEREDPSNGEREREGPKMSAKDRVIVRERVIGTEKKRERPSNGKGEREGPCDDQK